MFVSSVQLILINNSDGLYKFLLLDESQKSSVGHTALYSNLIINNYLCNTDVRTETVTSGTQRLITTTVHG